jgi:hypothetical protein
MKIKHCKMSRVAQPLFCTVVSYSRKSRPFFKSATHRSFFMNTSVYLSKESTVQSTRIILDSIDTTAISHIDFMNTSLGCATRRPYARCAVEETRSCQNGK